MTGSIVTTNNANRYVFPGGVVSGRFLIIGQWSSNDNIQWVIPVAAGGNNIALVTGLAGGSYGQVATKLTVTTTPTGPVLNPYVWIALVEVLSAGADVLLADAMSYVNLPSPPTSPKGVSLMVIQVPMTFTG